jgi:transposase
MQVVIGIDPHKATHTAAAAGGREEPISSVKMRAPEDKVDQFLSWAKPPEKPTWAIESAGGLGYLLSNS